MTILKHLTPAISGINIHNTNTHAAQMIQSDTCTHAYTKFRGGVIVADSEHINSHTGVNVHTTK